MSRVRLIEPTGPFVVGALGVPVLIYRRGWQDVRDARERGCEHRDSTGKIKTSVIIDVTKGEETTRAVHEALWG